MIMPAQLEKIRDLMRNEDRELLVYYHWALAVNRWRYNPRKYGSRVPPTQRRAFVKWAVTKGSKILNRNDNANPLAEAAQRKAVKEVEAYHEAIHCLLGHIWRYQASSI